MSSSPSSSREQREELEIRRLAVEKMSAVLGSERAQQLLQQLTTDLGVELRTPQELYAFSQRLSQLGGFEGAVGAMLGVAAVIRGATAPRRPGTRGS